jgi:hypothetical protein
MSERHVFSLHGGVRNVRVFCLLEPQRPRSRDQLPYIESVQIFTHVKLVLASLHGLSNHETHGI